MTDQQKEILKDLSIHHLECLRSLARDMFLNWSTSGIKKDTEFETIWYAARTEGMVLGINDFLHQIETIGENV